MEIHTLNKNIVLLGSSGSIGQTTLDIIRQHSQFNCLGAAVNKSWETLAEQVEEFGLKLAVCYCPEAAQKLKKKLGKAHKTKVLSGIQGLQELASFQSADLVINAIVGGLGLLPSYAAIQAKKNLALANKESLVMAGEILLKEARQNKTSILPIDSEHSAIFQVLHSSGIEGVNKLYLTCSGGPFLNYQGNFTDITIEQSLAHPSWTMGKKITIDSATLVNKGLELIEAVYFFNIAPEKIEIVIHPESIIHSMVEYIDGSIISQMSLPNMSIPIQYALSYPQRLVNNQVKPLEFNNLSLNFFHPDRQRFPTIDFAYDVLKKSGLYPTVFNAINEVCVKAFLDKKITFNEIFSYIKEFISRERYQQYTLSIDNVLFVDKQVREEFQKIIRRISVG